MPRILVEVELQPDAMERLRALPGASVETIEPHGLTPWELPADHLPGPEVLLCKRPPSNLDSLTNLRLVHISTVGYEHLRDMNFATRPVRFCNARGLFDVGIAEWNVAMMIALTRDLPAMLRDQASGEWHRPGRYQSEVRGRTVGVWGYGGIGRETARLAKALGLIVHGLTRSGVKPRGDAFAVPGTGDPEGVLPDRTYTPSQKDEFLASLDFLVLALPHTKESDGMIGEVELRALPRSAYLLNPARGKIVQEAALLRALREGWIAGAALDTHFAYPLPADHALRSMPNVILTPHVSGGDGGDFFPRRVGELFVENTTRYVAGRPLLNEVTPQEWLEA